MDLQIKHAVIVKVIGMTRSCGQVTQFSFRMLKSYPQICFNSSFANEEKYAPRRFRIPLSFRIRFEKSNQLLNIHAEHHSLSALRVLAPSRCELSNTRLPVNFNQFRLMAGQRSTYFCTAIRSFSQNLKPVTIKKCVFSAASEGDGKDSSSKSLNKHRKSSLASIFDKEISESMDRLTTSRSKGIGLKNAKSPSLNGQIVKDVETSIVTETVKTSNGKVKPKSGSKKKLSSVSSEKVNAKAQQPAVPEEIAAVSLTEVSDSEAVTKNVRSKVTNTKKKSSTETQSSGKKVWPKLYPPAFKSVLVVESATKAKLIQGYLGEMFEVVPSYGHVRDLAARSGSVRPDDDFSMVWEVPSAAWSHLKSIKVALTGAKNLILATDPDREGEAIAWHVVEMLHQQDALPKDFTIARITFHEITESSIKDSLMAPRAIDSDLVNAYLARRALDYLIGFNVSPLLWRKLPGCQSAGRVQSATLALICDQEKEIDEFKTQEYWTVEAQFQKAIPDSDHKSFITSQLTRFASNKLTKFSISSDQQARDVEEKIRLSEYFVVKPQHGVSQKHPPHPYITSTLQQDAANRFNFSASRTMSIAQKLYEGVQLLDGKASGLITYIRTDGFHISDQAAKDIHFFVADMYGKNFASDATRRFFKKVKNAQEAHEAIRPTDIRRLPSKLVGVLDDDSLKLYTLIWCRTMACQMAPAIIKQIQCDIGSKNESVVFRASSSRVDFLGFQAVYEDAEANRISYKYDDDDDDDDDAQNHNEMFEFLSELEPGQELRLSLIELSQHQTQPPPRYTEASLVKKLEELGIGRPSTYATTIKVLKDRNYIASKNKALHPEFRGRMVSAFLSNYFSEVTDYSFTADMESELDNVSAGTTEWKRLLKDYWTRFSEYCENVSSIHIHQVEKMLEKTFGAVLFSPQTDANRTCPSCGKGTLVFKVSKFGAGYFIGCNEHPNCRYIAKTLYGEEEDDEDDEKKRSRIEEPKLLGVKPGSNENVLLKKGPYGYYVQLGDDRKNHVPKRTSIYQVKDMQSITLEYALDILKYPITLGKHPDDGQAVILRLTKDGFSIRHRRSLVPVPKEMKGDDVNLEKALELLKGNGVRNLGRPKLTAAQKKKKKEELIEMM